MANLVIPRVALTVVALKAEVTSGTDVFAGTYTTADIANVDPESIRFTPDPNETEVRATGGHFGRQASVLGATTGRLDCTMPIRGAGAAYSASVLPEAHKLLLLSMLQHAVVTTAGSETVTYKPTDTESTYTVYVVYNIPGGNAHVVKMTGCIASVRFRAVAGEGLFADFSIIGGYTRGDHAYLAGTVASTPQYPTFKNAAFQIGTTNYGPCLGAMTLDAGVTTRYQRCANAVSAVAGAFVSDRRPRLSFTSVLDRELTFAWWGRLSTGGPLDDCSYSVLGAGDYNKITFQFGATLGPQLQTISQSIIPQDGIVNAQTELQPTISGAGGNPEDWAIVFVK